MTLKTNLEFKSTCISFSNAGASRKQFLVWFYARYIHALVVNEVPLEAAIVPHDVLLEAAVVHDKVYDDVSVVSAALHVDAVDDVVVPGVNVDLGNKPYFSVFVTYYLFRGCRWISENEKVSL